MTEQIKVKMKEYGVKPVHLQLFLATSGLWEFMIFHEYGEKICIT
jgi:hypothetical protein